MQHYTYYVYYRIAPGDDTQAEAAVTRAEAEIASRTGARTSLLKKRDEPNLWMEVYENIADAERFEHVLAEAVATHQLSKLVLSETVRVTECFVVPECA